MALNLGHQAQLFDALSDYADFYLIVNSVRKWNKWIRPIPDNVHFVPYYESGKYDLALLHIDNQCVSPDMGKAILFRDLKEVTQDIPQIIINHGSPCWPENAFGWSEEEIIERMRLMIGDAKMIVNSNTAEGRWGWGQAIIHGMRPEDYYDYEKEPRVITTLSGAGMDKYYNRRLLSEIKKELIMQHGIRLQHITVDWHGGDEVMNGERANELSSPYEAYKDYIARALVYVNCTYDSPMPRSRTEAMLSGACVVTSKYHDADKFIKNGVNGFILPDNPQAYVDLIAALVKEFPSKAKQIGQAGKKTAIDMVSMDRYRGEWLGVLEEVLGKKIARVK